MEDVLTTDQREYDDDTVLVGVDETSKQQTKETRTPRPTKPGHPAIYDYEYERNGTANLFMSYAPSERWRHVKVTDRRTKQDCTHLLKDLADVHFPRKKSVLVMDNRNTHHLATLYRTFKPEEAGRLSHRFEVHYTPKHGRWLNMAEREINVLSKPCLNRRIPDRETMVQEIAAWQRERNGSSKPIKWQFRTKDARIKLKSLYPSVQ